MHMRNQEERRFAVRLNHTDGYQFRSQASEDGVLHGDAYFSDEPDPVGAASAPATPALLASALGHCLSASLLEALKHSDVELLDVETEAVAVVALGASGLPRIREVDVTIRPHVAAPHQSGMQSCENEFQNHCTVTCSVRQGIQVNVDVEWLVDGMDPADAARLTTPADTACAL
jgi:organic hydroperoxide reductase OsmC/OhrA